MLMRRRRKDNSKKKQLLVAIFFSVLMITSIFGIILGNNQGSQDFPFTNSQGEEFIFVIDENGYYNYNNIQFFYHPSQLSYLDFPFGIVQESNSLILTFDSSLPVQEVSFIDQVQKQVASDLSALGKPVTRGVSEESIIYSEFPVLNCADATPETPVLFFMEGNSSVEVSENCVLVLGFTNDFYAYRDIILLSHLGILKNG